MNDWIVANINNTDFSVSDFHDIANMDINNTQMLSKNQYLKSDFIKNNPLFQDKDGKFSEDKFDEFYKQKLATFQQFSDKLYPTGPALDMFDTNRTKDSRIKDVNFNIGRLVSNPDRQQIGIEGVNIWSDPTKSKSELAQMSQIYDWEKQEFLDYSPNDKALFNGKHDYGFGWLSSFFDDPLVEAVWEEEGTHIDPISRQEVKHQKGDRKLNDKGTYYYETLGGRSPLGKKVLSLMDTITVDDTPINKYDFFDSDDIEKSVGGTIAKNIVALVPMFIGGPVGTAYSTALIAREFSKSLPMLYGISTALFSDEESPRWINSISAIGEKFTGGTSDYAKEHSFSFENIGNMVSDVALQWGQQKRIAKVFNDLQNSDKYLKEATTKAKALYDAKKSTMGAQAAADDINWMNSNLGKAALKKYMPEAEKAVKEAGQLGRDMSLAYMAIVSNSDVYQDMLEHGSTKGEAAAVALGSTLGMFAVDKTGLGELFFDEATEESVKKARQALKNEFREAKKTAFAAIDAGKTSTANKYIQKIQKAAEIGKRVISDFSDDLKYHTTNFVQKAVGEGIEEVAEEVVADTAKSIYEIAGKLGADTSVKDVGAWDNAFERYTMNFLGGTIGGGIFYGKEVWDKGTFRVNKSDEELVTLIRNGHIGDLKDALQEMKDAGKIGSTKISGRLVEKDENGKPVWLSAKSKEDSQNNVIANLVEDKINALDAIINNNQIGLDDNELFRRMVLSEERFTRYQAISPLTNYYQDYNNVIMDLIKAEQEYNDAAATIEGTSNGTPITGDQKPLNGMTNEEIQIRTNRIQEKADALQRARDKKNVFLSGDTSLDYARKLNFLMDPILHEQFLPLDESQVWKEMFGNKKQDEVTPDDMLNFYTELRKRKQEQLKTQGTDAWERFKGIEKIVAPEMANMFANADQFKQWSQQIMADLNGGILDPQKLEDSKAVWNTQLATETPEDFAARDTKINVLDDTGVEREETDEEFENRKLNRQLQIIEFNNQKDIEYVQLLKDKLANVGYVIDPITYNALFGPVKKIAKGTDKVSYGVINTRLKDIINEILKNRITNSRTRDILSRLALDLSNANDLIEEIKESKKGDIIDKLIPQLKEFANTELTYADDGYTTNLIDFINSADPGNTNPTLDDILNNKFIPQIGNEIDEESTNKLIEIVQQLKNVFGGNATLTQVLSSEMVKDVFNGNDTELSPIFDKYVETQISATLNSVQNVIQEIQRSPFFGLQENLKKTVKNPIIELVTALVGKTVDNVELPKIKETLEQVQDDFQNIEDIDTLILDDSQLDAMYKTRDALRLIGTFMYAASANADMNTPIGHNKIFNEFAKKHSDMVEKWEELPEIADDYATLFSNQISSFDRVLSTWIDFSNNNAINKRAQFVKTDAAFVKSLWDKINDHYNAEAFTVNIDDKRYNLLEGFGSIPKENNNIALFESEKLLYLNFQKALEDSGLSVRDFLSQSGLIEKLISGGVESQSVSKLDDKLTKNTLTDYDALQYYAMALTLDPVDFYTNLRNKVKNDEKTAPITAQEYGQKLVLANKNQQFRDILKYAFDKTGDDRYAALNTVVITGAAGAGKTQVVARVAIEGVENKENIVALGPTSTQALGLQKVLGLQQSNTVEEFARKILGDNVYTEIMHDVETGPGVGPGGSHNLQYFSVKEKNELVQVNLNVNSDGNIFRYIDGKPDEIVKFNTLEKIPEVVIIDEATHVSAPILQAIDLYMRQNNGQLIVIGDPNQAGYWNLNNGIKNFEQNNIFATRAPELQISLRDNNIQKQANLQEVRALLATIEDIVINKTDKDLEAYLPTAINIAKKFAFKAYNQDEINGDLIVDRLDDDLIRKIKAKAGKLGFVGNKSSQAYQQLISSGLEEGKDIIALTKTEMQGQEFDYVIIDDSVIGDMPIDKYFRWWLKDLYTVMSRGRDAAIFVDSKLSSLIGENRMSTHKAKAPSLLDKAGGISAVDELRNNKLNILNAYNLTPLEVPGKKTEEKKLDDASTLEEILKRDPDEEESDASKDKVIKDTETDDIQDLINRDSDFPITTYGNTSYLSLTGTENDTVEGTDKNGNIKEYSGTRWIIEKPSDGPLRNLQGLIDGDRATAFWHTTYDGSYSKTSLQKDLNDVKSTVIYQHSYDELRAANSRVASLFNKKDWEDGQVKLEIREANDTLPIYSTFDKIGTEYKGHDYIIDLVFQVKDKNGRTVLIDLSSVNLPTTLKTNLQTIKDKINAKLSAGKITDPDTITKLNNILVNIDSDADTYESIFDQWITDYNNRTDKDSPFLIDINDALDFNKTTWFAKRKKGRKKIRLGGTINPALVGDDEAIKKDKNINFKTLNPHIVTSKVYTYSSNKKELENLDPSIKGKAVVFISSDTLLKPNQLIHKYIEQKRDPKNNTPAVRMLVLDNYGMSFSQFMDPQFIKSFQGGEDERQPIRQNFKGIQMFTSMWNFRAALSQFQNALNGWKLTNSYTDDKVKNIIKAANDIARDAEESEVITKYGITKDDLKNLDKFNKEILKDIPIFRLGYQENGNGFHIQQFDITGSSAYDDGKIKLLSIDPDKAITFYNIINKVLNAIVPTTSSINGTLGTRLLKEDRTPWKEDELIDLKQAKHRRSLSGLLHFDEANGLYLADTDEEGKIHYTAYREGDNWSLIPGFISKIVSTTTRAQYDENLDDMVFANIYKGKDKQQVVGFQVGAWLSDGTLKRTDFSGEKPIIDKTLFHLFDLIFHGTIEDIHSGAERLEDARFKYGFYIDPDATRVKNADGSDTVTVPVGDSLDDSLFLEISTSDGLFEVDVDPRASGININLERLVKGPTRKADTGETGSDKAIKSKEDEFKESHPDTWELMDSIRDQLTEISEDTVEDAANILTSVTLPGAILSFQNKIDDDLNTTAYYSVDKNNNIIIHTLKDYFQSLLPDGVEFTGAEVKEGEIIVNDEYRLDEDKLIKYTPDKTVEEKIELEEITSLFTEDEKEQILDYLNGEYKQEYLDINPTDEDTYNTAIAELQNILDSDNGTNKTDIREKLDELFLNWGSIYYDILADVKDDINKLLKKCE